MVVDLGNRCQPTESTTRTKISAGTLVTSGLRLNTQARVSVHALLVLVSSGIELPTEPVSESKSVSFYMLETVVFSAHHFLMHRSTEHSHDLPEVC